MMIGRWDKVARGIKAFVENPFTKLVKGVVLVVIGVSGASETIRDDFLRGHARLGHGLIIIGFFSILDALPTLIEGLESWVRFVDLRQERKAREQDRP